LGIKESTILIEKRSSEIKINYAKKESVKILEGWDYNGKRD
jgi:hypothetical protein